MTRPLFPLRALAVAVLLATACGGASPTTSSPPPPSPPTPAPVADPRCTAPAVWVQPGCGAATFSATTSPEGCYVSCERPGGTTGERRDPSACAAGFTCTAVQKLPDNDDVSEVCGVEAHLCLPMT